MRYPLYRFAARWRRNAECRQHMSHNPVTVCLFYGETPPQSPGASDAPPISIPASTRFFHAIFAFGATVATPGTWRPNSPTNNSIPFKAAELSESAAIGYTRRCACGNSPVTVTEKTYGRCARETSLTEALQRGVAFSRVRITGS